MKNWSMPQTYAVASALVLFLLVLVNDALAMLVVSIIGLVAGIFVARSGEMWRPAMVAMAGFGAMLAFSLASFWL